MKAQFDFKSIAAVLALLAVGAIGVQANFLSDDPGEGEEEGGIAAWTIIHPAANFNYSNAADVPTNGTKLKRKAKVEWRCLVPNQTPAVVKTALFNDTNSETWSTTFQPTPTWPTPNKNIGETHGYDVALYDMDVVPANLERNHIGLVTRLQ